MEDVRKDFFCRKLSLKTPNLEMGIFGGLDGLKLSKNIFKRFNNDPIIRSNIFSRELEVFGFNSYFYIVLNERLKKAVID